MLAPLHPRRLAVVLTLASLLLLPSCFDVPLGDPATSQIDPRLIGYWDQQTDGGNGTLVAVAAFDEHAYLVAFHNYKREGEHLTRGEASFHKAWLTIIRNEPFLTILPMHNMPGLGDDGSPSYVHVRLGIEDAAITARGLEPDAAVLKQAKNPAALAHAIDANLEDPALYAKAQTYRKLHRTTAADRRLIETIIEGDGAQ